MEASYTIRGAHHHLVVGEDGARLYVNHRPAQVPVVVIEAEQAGSLLDQLADAEGIWGGPATRRELHDLAERALPGDAKAADYARLFRRFARAHVIEEAAEFRDAGLIEDAARVLGSRGGRAGKGKRHEDAVKAARARWADRPPRLYEDGGSRLSEAEVLTEHPGLSPARLHALRKGRALRVDAGATYRRVR